MGQIPKKAPKVALPYRADPAQVAAIDDVVQEEGGEEQVSRSEVIEYLVGLALPLYWARADVGHARIDAVVERHGGDSRAAYAELLTLGLVAMELDPKLFSAAIEERNRRVHGLKPQVFILGSEEDVELMEGVLKRFRQAQADADVHDFAFGLPHHGSVGGRSLEAIRELYSRMPTGKDESEGEENTQGESTPEDEKSTKGAGLRPTAEPESMPSSVYEERRKNLRIRHVGPPEEEKSTTGVGPRRTSKPPNVPGAEKDTEDYRFERTLSPGRSRRPQPPKPEKK